MSTTARMIDPERQMLGEVAMVGPEPWEEIHRRAGAGASIRAIARELDLDRKRVRRRLRQREVEAVPVGGAGRPGIWSITRRRWLFQELGRR